MTSWTRIASFASFDGSSQERAGRCQVRVAFADDIAARAGGPGRGLVLQESWNWRASGAKMATDDDDEGDAD